MYYVHREIPGDIKRRKMAVQTGAQQSLIDLAVTVTTGLPCVSLCIIF